MDRRYSVKYRPGASREVAQQPRSTQETLNTTYDSSTDNDIFALGDAATGFNIDDLFKDFGMSLNQALQGQFPQGPTKVSYQLHKTAIPEEDTEAGSDQPPVLPPGPPPPDPSDTTVPISGTLPPKGHTVIETSTISPTPEEADDNNDTSAPGQKDIQVQTITKTLPDGRTVQTRIVRGPVQRKARIIKINRELPNGETELLSTLELPGDQEVDINETVKNIVAGSNKHADSQNRVPEAVVTGIKRGHKPPPLEQYDNLPQQNHVQPFPPPHPTPVQAPLAEISEDVKPIPSRRQSLKDKFRDKFRSRSPSASSAPLTPTPSMGSDSQKSPFERTNSIGPIYGYDRRGTLADEDAIQLYKPDGIVHTLDMGDEDEESVCPRWCPAIWTRKKHSLRVVGHDAGKGRYGMTQSEINPDDKSLPGVKALVANYARMLYEDRAQFVTTLFRAVKLNKLDVLRILCKIVQKSGQSLSDRELREPESSATVLHVALLYNHHKVVDYIINHAKTDLLIAKYENEEYMNQTGLHVAVANGNVDMVQKLLYPLSPEERQDLINQLADGHYFRTNHHHGQLCLTAAAWAGSTEIIRVLVTNGGNLALKNLDGNTMLHSIVLQSITDPRKDYKRIMEAVWEATGVWAEQMVYSTRNVQQRALESNQMQINLFRELLAIRNNDGYTPLALATKESSKLLQIIINLEKIYKIPQNKLGSVAWVTYDVTDITTFAYDTYNKFSMLHILGHNSKRLSRHANLDGEEVDYLDREPINALVICKWSVYRWIYIGWFIIHLSYMILFTSFTVETNSSPISANGTKIPKDLLDVHYGYTFFLFLPVVYIVLEILDLFGNKPYRIQFMSNQNYVKRALKCIESEWTITGNGPYRLVGMGFSYYVVEWFFLYAANDEDQDISLAMALLLGWIFVLFFTRACRITCRFSIMIQKMFFRDLIYFLTVYGIILIAFSFAMNSMFTYQRNADITINKVFYDMMNVVTDLDKKQSIVGARHQLFARLLLILYAIMSVILLMNMLIAMMNTSYETIRITRCNLWRQQQLSIMLLIERRLFWLKCLCQKSERDVWRKEQQDGDLRCYLDVTVLHTPNYTITS